MLPLQPCNFSNQIQRHCAGYIEQRFELLAPPVWGQQCLQCKYEEGNQGSEYRYGHVCCSSAGISSVSSRRARFCVGRPELRLDSRQQRLSWQEGQRAGIILPIRIFINVLTFIPKSTCYPLPFQSGFKRHRDDTATRRRQLPFQLKVRLPQQKAHQGWSTWLSALAIVSALAVCG